MFGYPLEDWYTNDFWANHIHPEDLDGVLAFYRGKAQTKGHELEYRLVHANGEEIWIRDVVSVITIGDEPALLRGIILNITDRKLAENKLSESEKRLRTLLNNSPDDILIIGLDESILYVNRAWRGLSLEQIIGKKYEDFHAPAQAVILRKALQEVFETGKPTGCEIYAGGRWYADRIAPIKDSESNEVTSAIIIATDITDRRRDHEELAKSEKRFRDLFEGSPDTILVFDDEGNVLDANPAATRLYGMAYGELTGSHIQNLLPADHREENYVNLRSIVNEKEHGYLESQALTKDGQIIPVERRATRFQYADKSAILLHIHDISDRQRLERQLLQAQKMEAVGRLAGGVAHDFNNLLTIIIGNTEFGLQDTQPGKSAHKDFLRIEAAANQARDLVTQLLTFSRTNVHEPKLISLNRIIENHVKMLNRIIGEDIQMRLHLEPGLSPILADPAQIQQVLMNLSINARDAMPSGGRLTVKTHHFTASESMMNEMNKLTLETRDISPSNDFVEMSIADSGTGMDSATQSHMFEPFFTTKAVGKGSGLGLAVVYGIAKQHGALHPLRQCGRQGQYFQDLFPGRLRNRIEQRRKWRERHDTHRP